MPQHREVVITPSSRSRRHASRRRSSASSSQPHRPNPAYVIEVTPHTRQQRGIRNGEELKRELAAGESHGCWRVVVVRGSWRGVGDVLRTVMGSWDEQQRRSRRGGAGCRCFPVWEYPGMESVGSSSGGEDHCYEVVPQLFEVGVWMEGRVPLVLLDDVFRSPSFFWEKTRRRGRMSADNKAATVASEDGGSSAWLETGLWVGLDASRSLEDVVAELVYEQWLDFLESLSTRGSSSSRTETLWMAMKAVERIVDNGHDVHTSASSVNWMLLTDRIHRRLQLSLLLLPRHERNDSQQDGDDDGKDANARSLDRISYLGGLLLPMTVVSGILAIEGPFGPQGSRFWVFWLVAGIASLVALLVIHADKVRTIEVWIEDTDADTDVDSRHNGRGHRRPSWRRRQLGWAGALKKMFGWYSWRGSPGLAWRMPTLEEQINRMV